MGIYMGEKRPATVSIRRVKGSNVIEGEIAYRVVATFKEESRLSIMSTAGLPIVGVTVSASLGLCKSKRAVRNTEQPLEWEVIAEFSSEVEEGTDPTTPQIGNPVSWVPLAEINFEVIEEEFVKDINGTFYGNSAGQRFSEFIALPITLTRWDFFQFEPPSLSIKEIGDRNNKLNAGTFLGCPAKSLLLQVRKASLGYYYAYRCWLIEYSLRYKPEYEAGKSGWKKYKGDIGAKYKSGGQLVDYFAGQPGIEGNLNGSGGKVTTPGDHPAILSFDRFKTDSFGFLRLS